MSMAEQWSKVFQQIEEHIIPGKRLGRQFGWDSRSAAYLYQATRPEDALADQLHKRHTDVLDQGDIGSCTGNAQTGVLSCDPFFAVLPNGTDLTENGALMRYALATALDGYPGTFTFPPPGGQDTGSDGTSVCKGSQKTGEIAGYTHATSVTAMADALQTVPLIVGVNWYEGYDEPDQNGLVHISGSVRGGHEFLIRGVKISERLFLADNSWGAGYGNNGSFEITWDDMTRLLAEQGDCTVSVPLNAPAPVPVPVPTPDVNTTFAAVLSRENANGVAWVDQRHEKYVETVAKAGRVWLNAQKGQ